MNFDPGTPPPDVTVTLQHVDGVTSQLTTFDSELIKKSVREAEASESPIAGLLSKIQFAGMPIPHAGRLTAKLKAGDTEIVCAAITIVGPSRDPSPTS